MNPRRFTAGLSTVACFFAITVALQYVGRNSDSTGMALAQEPASGTIAFDWSLPLNGFRSASFSPDDAYFTVVGDPAGTVTLRHRGGPRAGDVPSIVWRRPVPNVTNAVVGPEGKSVLAFASMDPTRQAITIIKGLKKDADTFQFPLDGAIWAATISGDGMYAAVVTGGHSLYIFTLDGKPQFQRLALSGTGNSIAISHDGSFLASGTWNESGVSCFNVAGAELWHYQEQNSNGSPVVNRLFEAQIAKDSPYILGLSYANVQKGSAKIYLWRKTGRGNALWTYPLQPEDSDPQTMIASNGSRVAVSYLHKITHGDKILQERQLVMLDRFGSQVWPIPKGGLLMSPNLVAISPDGNTVTVTDGQSALYNYDSDGRISAHSKQMTGLIHRTIPSVDGRFVLVYTTDGKLTLVRPT